MTTAVQAFGILLRTGRNLKAQGLPVERRSVLLRSMRNVLYSFPMQGDGIRRQYALCNGRTGERNHEPGGDNTGTLGRIRKAPAP